MRKKMMVFATVLALVGCSNNDAEEPVDLPVVKEVKSKETVLYSPLTGEVVNEEKKQYFSVMIENSPNARPQTGLASADIVYEIKTEGNISRYLAFYHHDIPKTIGPVRSSRHYFIGIAEEYNSPYIHFGASTYAYKYLRSNQVSVPHIDGISEGKYFFRDNARKAPHNAYLNTASLANFEKNKPKNEHVTFGKNKMEKGAEAKIIGYRYNDFTNIRYEYDAKEKLYLRFQEGKPHIDQETEEQIKVKNILFQFTEHKAINEDTYGRIDVNFTGTGKALYISEGKHLKATWKKENQHTSTIYYDEEGSVLKMNPGNTWIQVVETNALVEINE